MTRDTVLSPDAPKPLGPYSQAVRAGGLVFVAGQLPLDVHGGVIGQNDIARQTETVFAHMAAILREAGSSMEKVVKTTVFLTNLGLHPGDGFTRRHHSWRVRKVK